MVLVFASTTFAPLRAIFYFPIPLFLFTNRENMCEKLKYFIVSILFALSEKKGRLFSFYFTCNIKLEWNNGIQSQILHIPYLSVATIYLCLLIKNYQLKKYFPRAHAFSKIKGRNRTIFISLPRLMIKKLLIAISCKNT